MEYLVEGVENYLFIFVFLALLEGGLCFYYRRCGVRLKKGFLLGWQLYACLLVGIFSITGAAGVNDIGRYGDELIRMEEISLIPLGWGLNDLFGLIMNVILFLPLGAVIPMLWKEGTSFKNTALTGFSFSLLIEVSQLFNRRATDIDDLLMNTLGTVLGYGFYALCLRKCRVFQLENTKHNWLLKNSAWVTTILIFFLYFLIGRPFINFMWNCI